MSTGMNQVDVSVRFTANTDEAKRKIQELQSSLTSLTKNSFNSGSFLGLDKEMNKAVQSAMQLKGILSQSLTNAGTLDIGKFSQNIERSGISIKQFARDLQSLGPQGTQAFSQLSQSIAMAEVPLRRTSALMNSLGNTLKNTAKWQLSSSLLHGFISAVQGAFSYAQDLNESLNNIRIVTGQNADQMADFAQEANKAAKALSTTTTEYTNASLIYYQQGLSESEVKERTDITIKMANAAGQSAEVVSDQMTAVWNNFDDGSKSLEYYADVMTALGAATASSTDEIAEGLEKFSAVADTVGLSYEYATAALATVTAETRQSAEVVGTAFKTLFARIEGLKLGDTLEDGTTLNKYSEALFKVGINIKDANGELKDMDIILSEMGERWDTLSKDQQVALAQAVGGIRQYNQLISLMDNWDVFKENLETIADAEGTLTEQANIYADSWEASKDRVTASAEAIYSALLKDDFFIGLNNTISKILDSLSNILEALGGAPGLLALISSFMFKAFGPEIATSIERAFYNMRIGSEWGRNAIIQLKKETNQATVEMLRFAGSAENALSASMVQSKGQVQEQLLEKTLALEAIGKSISAEEQDRVNTIFEVINALEKEAEAENQIMLKKQRNISLLEEEVQLQLQDAFSGLDIAPDISELPGAGGQLAAYRELLPLVTELELKFNKIEESGGEGNFQPFIDQILQLDSAVTDTTVDINKLTQTHGPGVQKAQDAWQDLVQTIKQGDAPVETIKQKIAKFKAEVQNTGAKGRETFQTIAQGLDKVANSDRAKQMLASLKEGFGEIGVSGAEVILKLMGIADTVDMAGHQIDNFKGKAYTMGDAVSAFGQQVSAVGMALSSLQGLESIWSNEDMSVGEKLISTITSLSMILPMLTSAFDANNKKRLKGVATTLTEIALGKAKLLLDKQELGTKLTKSQLQAAEIAKNNTENATLSVKIALKTILQAMDLKELIIKGLLLAVILALVIAVACLVKSQKEQAEAAKELAEADKEKLENMRDQKEETESLTESIVELTKAYTDYLRTGQDVAKTTEDIDNQTEKLIKAYKDLGVDQVTLDLIDQAQALGLASGNWAAYYAAIAEAEKQAEDNVGKQAVSATATNLNALYTNLTVGSAGYRYGSGIIYRDVTDPHDDDVEEIIDKYIDSGSDAVRNLSAGDFTIQIDTSSVQAFLKDYEDLQSIQADLAAAGKQNTDLYKAISEELEEASQFATLIVDALDQAADYQVKKTLQDTGIDGEQIHSLEEYIGVTTKIYQKAEALKLLVGEEKATSYIQKTLGTLGDYTEYENELTVIQKLLNNINNSRTVNSLFSETSYNVIDEDEADNAIIKEVTDYISSLTEEDLAIAMSINFTYVESLEEFKASLEGLKELKIAAKFTVDSEANLQEATATRDNLSDIMEEFKDQGHISVSQAAAFIEEYPQYINYLVKTEEGYKLSTEAIHKFNTALEDQEKALDSMLNPANIGKEAIYGFAEKLIGLKNAFSSNQTGYYNFIENVKDLNVQFVEGKVEAEEYFSSVVTELDKVTKAIESGAKSSKNLAIFTNEVMAEMILGTGNYIESLDAAFEAGSIGAVEYRKNVIAGLKAIEKQGQTTKKTFEKQLELNSEKDWAKEVKQYQNKKKKYEELSKEAKEYVDELASIEEKNKQLSTDLENAELFTGVYEAAEEFYPTLEEIFQDDFTLKIGVDTDEAARQLKGFEAELLKLPQAQREAMAAYIENNAELLKVNRKTADRVIANAKSILNGTANAATMSTEDFTEATGVILQAGAETMGDVGTAAQGVVEAISDTLDNFTVTITATPKIVDWVQIFDNPALDWIKFPVVEYTVDGGLGENTKNSISAIGEAVADLANLSSGNSVDLGSYRPEGTAGDPEDIELDDEDDDKDKDDKDKSKVKSNKQIERYKELNDAIDQITDTMEEAADAADHLYGGAKIDALEEEIAASENLVEIYKQQIEEAEAMRKLDQQHLDNLLRQKNIHFQYEEGTGRILNYTQALLPLYEQLLEYERQMANMSKEEQEKFKKSTYEPLLEYINDVEAAVKQYDQTRKLITDTQKSIREEVQKQKDKKLQIFKYKIELELDINEREMKVLDLLLKRIEDDAFNAAEKIELFGKKAGEAMENYEVNKKGIVDLLAQHGLTIDMLDKMSPDQLKMAGLSEDEIKTLQELNEGMIESLEEVMELKDEAEQALVDLFDSWIEKIDETIDRFNLLTDTMSAFQNIADVLGHSTLGLDLEWQKKLIDTQNQIGLDQIESLVEKKNAVQKTVEEANKGLADAEARLELARKTVKDENVIKELEADVQYWQELVTKTEMELEQATADVYTSLDEFITQAAENYKRMTNAILEEWERSISAMGKTLAETMDMYDKASEMEDRYVSNYEKAYSLSKLTSDLEKSLNNTSSLKHQQQIKAMMEEIQEIQESGKMLSQYDLDYLQKKYELTVAQMALEDAHNAKTSVVRRRDSEGNWGYVYTANEEDKDAAMTTYRDKVYEMMELNENFIEDTEAKLLEARQRMSEEIAALADMALSEEEYNQRVEEIINHYQELDSYYLGEIEKAIGYNNTLYEGDALAFAEKAGFKLSSAIAFKNDYVTITEEMAATILSIEESTFKSREDYLRALSEATGLSINTVTKMHEDGIIASLRLSEEQRDALAAVDEQNFDNKEDYLKEIARITGLSIDEVTAMYNAGTLQAMIATNALEGTVLGSNTAMTLSFGQTTLSTVTGYATSAAAGAAFGAANTVLTGTLSANYASFSAVVNTALGIADMSLATFGAVSSTVMDTAKTKSNNLKSSVKTMGSQMTNSFKEGRTAVSTFQSVYSAKIGKCTTDTLAFTGAITALMAALKKASGMGSGSSVTAGSSGATSGLEYIGNAVKNGTVSIAEAAEFIAGSIWMDGSSGWGNGQERVNKINEIFGTENGSAVYDAVQDIINAESYEGITYSKWHEDMDNGFAILGGYSYESLMKDLAAMDTGGYTGKWGPEGKIAMLHEKELVLNKQDTSNFLVALDVLDRIITNISANSLLSNPLYSTSINGMEGIGNNEQNITIHAEFPDATSAKDIEEAFNLMINRASQYANRK